MGGNPYEVPRETGAPPRPERDYSLVISIVVALVVIAVLLAMVWPVGNKA